MPRKKPLKEFTPPDNVLIIYSGGNKNFDQDTIKESFVQRVIGPHVLRHNQKNALLFIDSAPCHKPSGVKTKLNQFNIDLEMIPPRMTGLVQPADVSWFRSVKAVYKKNWTNWYSYNDHAFTKSGNLKSPGYVNVSFEFILIKIVCI